MLSLCALHNNLIGCGQKIDGDCQDTKVVLYSPFRVLAFSHVLDSRSCELSTALQLDWCKVLQNLKAMAQQLLMPIQK